MTSYDEMRGIKAAARISKGLACGEVLAIRWANGAIETRVEYGYHRHDDEGGITVYASGPVTMAEIREALERRRDSLAFQAKREEVNF